MAELDTSGGGKNKGNKVRSKKASTRVDLTAMVDLAFLLITFFMLTTTLSKPQAMDIAMPDKDEKTNDQLDVAASRTMTVLLGKDDKLEWFMGEIDKAEHHIDTYGKSGIRKALLENAKRVREMNGTDPKRGLVVLVKPSDASNYKNVVDIMDELNIANIQIMAIVDITQPDIDLLTKDGLL
jgi:biopolymer transport protein ExbD